MESRKRPLADDDDSVVTKKRILSGANGNPHVNGAAEHDDEAFGEKLEANSSLNLIDLIHTHLIGIISSSSERKLFIVV